MTDQIEAFVENITAYVPNLLGAILVLLIGWLIAKGIRKLVIQLLKKTRWDEKVLGRGGIENTNKFLGNFVYYIIMIMVILIVLEILGVDRVLDPLKNMVNEFLLFIPDLIGAFLIGFIGYLLAKFVSNLVNIGGGVLDRIVDRTSFKDTDKIVSILRKVVFIVIFVPFLIQAFNALHLEAISEPANNILSGFTEMIGEIIIASVILVIFIWGGKHLAEFLEDFFKSLGLDRVAEKVKIDNMIGSGQSLSKLIANLIYFFLVFFGVITAVEILGLDRLTETLNQILEITGQILFGLIILSIGNYISVIIYDTMTKSNNNRFIAGVVRVATLALFIAIALRTMGIANEIVELAFGLILGAIAVAVALSYGLGGREAAGEHFKEIIAKFRNESKGVSAQTRDESNRDSAKSISSRKDDGSNRTNNPYDNDNRKGNDPSK